MNEIYEQEWQNEQSISVQDNISADNVFASNLFTMTEQPCGTDNSFLWYGSNLNGSLSSLFDGNSATGISIPAWTGQIGTWAGEAIYGYVTYDLGDVYSGMVYMDFGNGASPGGGSYTSQIALFSGSDDRTSVGTNDPVYNKEYHTTFINAQVAPIRHTLLTPFYARYLSLAQLNLHDSKNEIFLYELKIWKFDQI